MQLNGVDKFCKVNPIWVCYFNIRFGTFCLSLGLPHRNDFMKFISVIVLGLITHNTFSGTWADGLFDELNKDFGSVPRGMILQHNFKIKNNTREVVGILGVRSSCGCTTIQTPKRYLQPGEESSVQVRMDSGRFRGPKTVSLHVKLDRPESHEVKIWVKANSRDDIALSPEIVDFKTVRVGEGANFDIQIRFFGLPDAEIHEVSTASGYLNTKFKQEVRSQSETIYTLSVELSGQAPVGKWYSDIWVETNQSSAFKIRIPVRMEIISALLASPASIEFGEVSKNQETERRVLIRGAKPFRLTKIEGLGDSVKVKFVSDQSKTTHVITLVLKDMKAGYFQGNVKAFTDIEDFPVLQIPVRGEIVP